MKAFPGRSIDMIMADYRVEASHIKKKSSVGARRRSTSSWLALGQDGVSLPVLGDLHYDVRVCIYACSVRASAG